jgi:DMSO/TMAO reductase YedYZ molybdopterin-dependent catalytic subunit
MTGLAIVDGAFAVVLLGLLRRGAGADERPPAVSRIDRRTVLTAGLGIGLLAASGTLLDRLKAKATFSYDGTRVDGPDIGAITPNDRFYVVTKNIIDPGVDAGLWRLDVAGLVERPQTYDLATFTALPAVDQETTLMCISNPIGGGLMSNAVWRGVRLVDLLETAGVGVGAVEVLCHAVDGYTDTIPIAKALEPTTLLAYRMNGEALPGRHGYPVRLLVPGMYGEKSLKWIDRIEVVDREVDGFYEQQGWGPDFVIPTRSRISGPDLREPVRAGATVHLVGQAFGGDRGIESVDVSTDGGTTWSPAVLDYPGTLLTWALWSFDWAPTRPGEYRLTVRATDGTGEVQTSRGQAIVPEGARGLHAVTSMVVA